MKFEPDLTTDAVMNVDVDCASLLNACSRLDSLLAAVVACGDMATHANAHDPNRALYIGAEEVQRLLNTALDHDASPGHAEVLVDLGDGSRLAYIAQVFGLSQLEADLLSSRSPPSWTGATSGCTATSRMT